MGTLDAAQQGDREGLTEALTEDALGAYDRREEEFGDELMRYLERQILLQVIDHRWREHLYEMDYLREGIHLRGFAQIDPLVAYKNEGFTMFQELMHSIWEEFARLIFHVQVDVAPAQARSSSPPRTSSGAVQYSGGGQEQPSALTAGGHRDRDRRGYHRDGRGSPHRAATASLARRPAATAGRDRHPRQGRAREDRAQRPVLVRVGQEVQEVPRGLRLWLMAAGSRTHRSGCRATRRGPRPAEAARGLPLTPLRWSRRSSRLEAEMQRPGFWDDQEQAAEVSSAHRAPRSGSRASARSSRTPPTSRSSSRWRRGRSGDRRRARLAARLDRGAARRARGGAAVQRRVRLR